MSAETVVLTPAIPWGHLSVIDWTGHQAHRAPPGTSGSQFATGGGGGSLPYLDFTEGKKNVPILLC